MDGIHTVFIVGVNVLVKDLVPSGFATGRAKAFYVFSLFGHLFPDLDFLMPKVPMSGTGVRSAEASAPLAG
jgi:hypothetical protein